MIHVLALGGLLFAGVADQRGSQDFVVPLRINSVPANSFRPGRMVTLKATFAVNKVPPLGVLCTQPGFTLRIYDAKLVAVDPPRSASAPVTPYLQQSGTVRDPLSGPNAMTVEKTFEAFFMPGPAKGKGAIPRIFVGLSQTCGNADIIDINETGTGFIHNEALTGTYLGGVFFKLSCGSSSCVYRLE
jgi:hypothetical protein